MGFTAICEEIRATALRQTEIICLAVKQKMLPFQEALFFFAERMGFEPTIQLPIY